ncbi:MAG: GrpB family protein [Candidatus Wukongarchaeota archaeon]|nr:GrpB family protein [Candidatus Wukongarchaeota archaeon]MDO8128504.1 GrpB family protein [Candidatus Wukongarchaeota archaeon]
MRSPVRIVDYDPQWPIQYEEEKDRILGVIGHIVLAIEHIGSTAVPGLGAKPIIDIMIAVRHLADAEKGIEPLKSVGYEYVPEFEDSLPERRFFWKSPPESRKYHIHMVELTSVFWQRHLLFRDYLRTRPKVAQEYYHLKKELAAKHGSDRDAYTDAKTSFIKSVEAKARSSE